MRPAALVVCLALAGIAGKIHAHPSDVSHLLVKIAPHRADIRLTLNLLTLTRFVPLDADGNGEVTRAELDAAAPALNAYLSRHVPVSLNGADDTTLGPATSIRPVWATSETAPIAASDYDQRWVDVLFQVPSTDLIDGLWIGFEIFEDTGYEHTVQGFFEEESARLEVPFTVAEPEFLYDTRLQAEPAVTALASIAPTPSRHTWGVGILLGAGLLLWAGARWQRSH